MEINLEPTVVKIEHFRSASDPEPLQVYITYTALDHKEQI